jgi:hypothetical protein
VRRGCAARAPSPPRLDPRPALKPHFSRARRFFDWLDEAEEEDEEEEEEEEMEGVEKPQNRKNVIK